MSSFSDSSTTHSFSPSTPRSEDDDDREHGLDSKMPPSKKACTSVVSRRKKPVPTSSPAQAKKTRSKTGCRTCRERKKRCDETKPECKSCVSNNYQCFYEPKGYWRRGRANKPFKLEIPTEIVTLSNFTGGMEGTLDQRLYLYFQSPVAGMITFGESGQSLLDAIVPIALDHTMVMHSLLYLSASFWMADPRAPKEGVSRRQQEHCHNAICQLRTGVMQAGSVTPRTQAPFMATTLLLCLQEVYFGQPSRSGSVHLTGLKEFLAKFTPGSQHEALRQMAMEFVLYCDFSQKVTCLESPVELGLLPLPEPMLPPPVEGNASSAVLLGNLTGPFQATPLVRNIRERNRQHLVQGERLEIPSGDVLMADQLLRDWTSPHSEHSAQHIASLLYRLTAVVYLQRSIRPSRPHESIEQAVRGALWCVENLPWGRDGFCIESVLLTPLFVLGCAAFEEEHRATIRVVYGRLLAWANLEIIAFQRDIVSEIWDLMDRGEEVASWDWESLVASKRIAAPAIA